jgi:pyruvate,water dikinase
MKILLGMAVSQGKAQGRVKIVRGLEDFEKFREGDILVTRITDPTMVVMMNKAAGIICDIGGLTSHPSIIAREMGTPCIVSAECLKTKRKATEVLREGMLVEMCGTTGEVTLIEED